MQVPSPLTRRSHLWQGFAIGIVTVFLGALLYLCFRKKIYANFRQYGRRKGRMDAKKMMLRQFQLEELEKATNKFSKDCLVGSGAFGNVYRGTFSAQGTLAIKKLHSDSYTNVEEFRNEVRLLSKVKHRNLVGLMGFCEEDGPKGAKILVYEYVPNGSLLDYIIGRGGKSLTWRQRVNIAIGAAKGIAHLHGGVRPSIIHRDIKPSNILVDKNFEAKVSDFGLVKAGPNGDQSHVSSQVKGTPGYLDPAYCSSLHLTPFSDVYSFGVILLQLVAARPAVDTSRSQSNHHIIDWARPSLERGNVEEILDANLMVEPWNKEMMLKMGELGLRCVVKVPKERPTMSQVWQELETALYSEDNFIHKQPPSRGGSSLRSASRATNTGSLPLTHCDYSQTSISIDGVGLQRFHVEMDDCSFQSTSLRCLEVDSVIIDSDNSQREIALI